jgi:hypothetical protein
MCQRDPVVLPLWGGGGGEGTMWENTSGEASPNTGWKAGRRGRPIARGFMISLIFNKLRCTGRASTLAYFPNLTLGAQPLSLPNWNLPTQGS